MKDGSPEHVEGQDQTSGRISRVSAQKIFTMRDTILTVHREINEQKHSKQSKKYYSQLNDFVDYLVQNGVLVKPEDAHLETQMEKPLDDNKSPATIVSMNHRRAFIASMVAFTWNIVLLLAKVVACIFSRSISIISSTIDSGVDILSSGITFFANYKIKHLNVYKHPQGKTRMIPLSIIVISVIMSVTSVQVIIESCNRMITKDGLVPEFSFIAIGIVIGTVVSKVILFFYCHSIKSPSANVLAQDSRNDVLSNTAILVGLLISNYVWDYGDCVCAIIISLYVFYNWVSTAISYFGQLVGKTASAQSLQLYGWVCLLHNPEHILYISTVRAYAFGSRYLLEVDIVLREDMPLRKAHDIGETLQRKLEALPDIERAFVHLDFEKYHSPEMEHKLGILF